MHSYVKRMADDMTIRNFADATIGTYTYHVTVKTLASGYSRPVQLCM